jgi:hypothetical protein
MKGMKVEKVKMSVHDRISQLMGLGIYPQTYESSKLPSSSFAVAEYSDGCEFIHKPSHTGRISKKKMPPAFEKIFREEGVEMPETNFIRTETHYLVRPLTIPERDIYSFKMPYTKYFPRYKNFFSE